MAARLERAQGDDPSTHEAGDDDHFTMAQELAMESMRFQIEMANFQLMSSVVQATKQGVSTLFQQQG